MKKLLCVLLVILCCIGNCPLRTDAAVNGPSVIAYTVLTYGARGNTVKNLQVKLAALGYYTGEIDGKYGPLTKKAVKSFQKDSGLEATGSANSNTQKMIFSAKAKTNSSVYSVKYNSNKIYYDIKLSNAKQDYVRKMCKKYNVSFELVLAVMKVESGYREKAKSKTNDYGIMQINKGNHSFLRKKLGVSNFLDFEDNTQAGIYMLSRYTAKHSDIHKVLMCYNLGEGAAAKKWKKGTMQTSYSKKVVSEIKALKRK